MAEKNKNNEDSQKGQVTPKNIKKKEFKFNLDCYKIFVYRVDCITHVCDIKNCQFLFHSN